MSASRPVQADPTSHHRPRESALSRSSSVMCSWVSDNEEPEAGKQGGLLISNTKNISFFCFYILFVIVKLILQIPV